MSTTPNMLLTLPDVSVTPGPEWAALINALIEIIDDHDHTSNKGKKVPISGIDVNQDLNMSGKQLLSALSVKFNSLSSALSGALNTNKIQVVNGDVWFTNAGGVPVQITSGNSIVSNVIIPPSPLMPSGTILDFAGSTAPVGFLLCDGSAISRTTFSTLFAAIGTIWGVGDGFTTFNLPNLNGRTTIGSGTYVDGVSGSITRSVAQTMGAEAHVLTTPQMPSHNHTQDAHNHTYFVVSPGGGLASGGQFGTPLASTGAAQPAIQSTGGGLAHNNMQPSLVILKMIKS
jgi:microcystin-dependent protein